MHGNRSEVSLSEPTTEIFFDLILIMKILVTKNLPTKTLPTRFLINKLRLKASDLSMAM